MEPQDSKAKVEEYSMWTTRYFQVRYNSSNNAGTAIYGMARSLLLVSERLDC